MDKNRNKIISVVIIVLVVALIVLALVVVRRYGAGFDDNNSNYVADDINYKKQKKIDVSDNEWGRDNNLNNRVGEKTAEIISPKTSLIVQKYYIDARNYDNLEEEKENMPAEFIAMDEDKLEDYLEDYLEDMPLNEYLDGLLSYEIIDFSSDKVVLRKTYAADWNENEYYLCDKDGDVVVYYSDKETVYEYTGIKTTELSAEEQVKLKIGYFVADEEELYALLESYSS